MGILCPICGSCDCSFSELLITFSCKNCHCNLSLCDFVAKSLSTKLTFDNEDGGFRKSKDSKISGLIRYNYQSSSLHITSYDLNSSLIIAEFLKNSKIPYNINHIGVEEFGGSCPICGSRVGISSEDHRVGCMDSRHFTFEDVETMVACLIKRQYPQLEVMIKSGTSKTGEVKTIYIVETVTITKSVDNPKKGLFQPKKINLSVNKKYDYGLVVKSEGNDHVIWVPKAFTNRGYQFVFMINGNTIKNLRAIEVNI